MKNGPVFDQIIGALALADSGTEQLDQCMKFNYSLSRKVPLRYKIIAIGFVRKYSLEELNDKLREYGLAGLYARNFWEASLIYAFSKGLSYKEWRALSDVLKRITPSSSPDHNTLGHSNVSMRILAKYLHDNSDENYSELLTRHMTMQMESSVAGFEGSEELITYLRSNIAAFSTVREKTRYYFCKYLYFYLDRKINNYLKIASRKTEDRLEDVMDELSVFKGAARIKKRSMSDEKIRDYLENAPISCGVLYAEFNEFFFDYVSLDWMNVLLEQAGDLRHLPGSSVRKLADAARHYDRKYRGMDDLSIIRDLDTQMEQHELELDREASLDSDNRGYQKNRMGENTVRKYIKGELDLDRVAFVCFLLFLASDLTKPTRLYLDEKRLNAILKECEFRTLDEYDDFDYFTIQYLKAEDPADYLMEEVTRYAFSQQNFYLYKLYQSSRSDDADLKKLLS